MLNSSLVVAARPSGARNAAAFDLCDKPNDERRDADATRSTSEKQHIVICGNKTLDESNKGRLVLHRFELDSLSRADALLQYFVLCYILLRRRRCVR